jgi:hypothetical protein
MPLHDCVKLYWVLMLARSLDDSFRGLSYPYYKIKLVEWRSICSCQLKSSNFRRCEKILATSTIQTKTSDEILYEHWTQVRKLENEYLKVCNFWSSKVHVPLWKHMMVKNNWVSEDVSDTFWIIFVGTQLSDKDEVLHMEQQSIREVLFEYFSFREVPYERIDLCGDSKEHGNLISW